MGFLFFLYEYGTLLGGLLGHWSSAKTSQCSFSLDHDIKDIKESENIASLHNQIASCDTILEASCFLTNLNYQLLLIITKLVKRQGINYSKLSVMAQSTVLESLYLAKEEEILCEVNTSLDE